jgi:3-oxoacyl-[acyl-carrier protein] reductase
MDLNLRGKRAFVSGSSKGIGFAVAEALAREGADLFLTARNGELLKERAGYLSKTFGVKAEYSARDLSTCPGAEDAVREGLKAFAGFDILVANCGGPKAGTAIETMDEECLAAGYNQTLLSTVRLVRGILPKMMERKWGRIVAITSVSVFEPIENLALSNTFRSGLTAFLKTLSNEVAKEGITVNAVCPGYTKTERLTELSAAVANAKKCAPEEILKSWKESIPARRLAEPEEIANAAVFLCSEKASYITGVSLPVDGGRLKGTLY